MIKQITEEQSKALHDYFEPIMFQLYEYSQIRKHPILNHNDLGTKIMPDILKILNISHIMSTKLYNQYLNGICVELPLVIIKFKDTIIIDDNEWTYVELIPVL